MPSFKTQLRKSVCNKIRSNPRNRQLTRLFAELRPEKKAASHLYWLEYTSSNGWHFFIASYKTREKLNKKIENHAKL